MLDDIDAEAEREGMALRNKMHGGHPIKKRQAKKGILASEKEKIAKDQRTLAQLERDFANGKFNGEQMDAVMRTLCYKHG